MSAAQTVVVGDADLTLEAFSQVVWGRAPVVISDAARSRAIKILKEI